MGYTIDPIPDMEYQRLLGGYIPGLIDPTCGRYCLKSLLKYWYQKREGGGRRVTRIGLEKPNAGWGNWLGFDPYDDYPQAKELLIESYWKPASADSWLELILKVGPIIICGKGVGTASPYVGHYILLVGIHPETPDETFHYLDPLVGNEVKRAPQAMQEKIEPLLVYAKDDIATKLNRSESYFTINS